MLSCNSQQTKSKLETLISENYCDYSGFSLYFRASFLKRKTKAKFIFAQLIYDDTCAPAPPLQHMNDIRGILFLKQLLKLLQKMHNTMKSHLKKRKQLEQMKSRNAKLYTRVDPSGVSINQLQIRKAKYSSVHFFAKQKKKLQRNHERVLYQTI